MSSRTNIYISIMHLLFLMKMTEQIHLFRMPPRFVGRTVKCCNPNNGHNGNQGDQTNVGRKKNDAPVEFRRDMTEIYLGNAAEPAPLSETDALAEKINASQPGLMDIPAVPFQEVDDRVVSPEEQKALACAKLPCQKEDHDGLVCACNFKSGRVVSFKNACDLRKHNCRFDTDFRIILNDVCPWQYESRHESDIFDYSNPSYYN